VGDSRSAIGYSILQDRITVKLKETAEILKGAGYRGQFILPKEFYDYMTGETPTGDKITILDVLDHEFLMLHEVVEISELKKMGIPISKLTITSFHSSVYEAHYTAFEYELNYALDKKDYDWLKVRMDHAISWLDDDSMPTHLVPQCKTIIEKFSEVLQTRE
jgi:hypothetical protein